MRIISFGDLYTDYYLSNDLVLGICGGKTNANIIANLSRYYDTAFLGVAGNDIQGQVAIKSLENLGVDVSKIEICEDKTKTFFIDSKGYKKECPYCGRNLSYQGTKVDVDKIKKNIKEDDLIVIDNVSETTLAIISDLNNRVFLDLGYLGDLMYYSLDEIEESLGNKFSLINMNERVYNILRKKFGIDSIDLYDLLKPDILIITHGRKGSDIIYNGILEEKVIEDAINEVEVSGSGDAYFSEFIRTYIEANYEINEKMLSLAYMRASSLSRFVLTNYGARTHLEPLYKINNYHECICRDIEINKL